MDFVNWRNEEYDYLGRVAAEPSLDAIAVAYVEQLEKLRFTEFVVLIYYSTIFSMIACFRAMYGSITSVPFLTYTPADFTRTSGLNAGARDGSKAFEAEHASTLRRYELQLNVVEDFERRHGITERWSMDHPEYIQAVSYSQERQFIRSVEELEGLVVRRLFELSKANLAGTGMYSNIEISNVIHGLYRLQDAEVYFKGHHTTFRCHSNSIGEVQ